jgi:hypothetical protein
VRVRLGGGGERIERLGWRAVEDAVMARLGDGVVAA